MEFLKVWAMTAIPALFAFAAIWRFMTLSVVARGRDHEAIRPDAATEPANLRKAA